MREPDLAIVVPRIKPSFEAFYAEAYDGLFRSAYLLCGSESIAEELIQDVFLAAYRRWDDIEHPFAYLHSALVNQTWSLFRHRRRERSHQPPRPAVIDLEIVELGHSLLRLPYRQRAVLVLRFYVGLDDARIAELLGCTESTVRSSARRAIARLRKELDHGA